MADDVLAIVHGRIVPIDGAPIDDGTVVAAAGRIAAVGGPELAVPTGAAVVDATGRCVLPG